MRMYGGRLLRNYAQGEIAKRIESRDAILMEVLTLEKKARVKIQGSDTYVVAYFPQNWSSLPDYMKPGNAVRISHTGGNRGRIEIVGNGLLIPTPVPGGSQTISYTLPDAVVSGLALDPNSGMTITIKDGNARFSNVESSFAGGTKTLDAAPAAGNFRYDVIVMAVDGIFDYIKGTAVTANPVMPATPANHLRCGWVLVPSGVVTIHSGLIGVTWTTAKASKLVVTVADNDLAWAELSTTITIDIKDQYDRAFSTSGTMTCSFLYGNGTISDGGSKAFTGSQVQFTYTRDQLASDESPSFSIVFNTLSANTYILLRDNSGNVM